MNREENTVVRCASVLFQALQGKQCRHPFTNRLLPIIADTLVDTQLGTGDKHSQSTQRGMPLFSRVNSSVSTEGGGGGGGKMIQDQERDHIRITVGQIFCHQVAPCKSATLIFE